MLGGSTSKVGRSEFRYNEQEQHLMFDSQVGPGTVGSGPWDLSPRGPAARTRPADRSRVAPVRESPAKITTDSRSLSPRHHLHP
jgi:hypothetical protein